MPANYYTPIAKGDPVDHDFVNERFESHDVQLTANAVSILALEAEVAAGRNGLESLEAAAIQVVGQTPPTTASDKGTAGELRSDTDKLYVCVATNTWKIVSLENWS